MRFQGHISEWYDSKGYGFVTQNGTGLRTFLHIKSFSGKYRRPKLGDSITYRVSKDDKGRSNAHDIHLIRNLTPYNRKGGNIRTTARTLPTISGSLGAGYVLITFILVFLDKLPNAIPAILVGMSLITFMMYYIDKIAAVKGAWRTPESTLHILGLLGGWPGAALAQKSFRHKSSKSAFQAEFWMTVTLNIGFVIWLMTRDPQESGLFKLLSF